jgi:hypothetical protein
MKNGALSMENTMAIPQKIKNRIICDPAIPLGDIHPTELRAGS